MDKKSPTSPTLIPNSTSPYRGNAMTGAEFEIWVKGEGATDNKGGSWSGGASLIRPRGELILPKSHLVVEPPSLHERATVQRGYVGAVLLSFEYLYDCKRARLHFWIPDESVALSLDKNGQRAREAKERSWRRRDGEPFANSDLWGDMVEWIKYCGHTVTAEQCSNARFPDEFMLLDRKIREEVERRLLGAVPWQAPRPRRQIEAGPFARADLREGRKAAKRAEQEKRRPIPTPKSAIAPPLTDEEKSARAWAKSGGYSLAERDTFNAALHTANEVGEREKLVRLYREAHQTE